MTDGSFREEIKNIRQDTSEFRKFGITFGVVFTAVGLLLAWKSSDCAYPALLTAAAFYLAGFVFPNALKGFHKAWMGLAAALGFVMTRIILTSLFYLIVTPLSWSARVAGKEFLDLKMDKNAKSYWKVRESVTRTKEDYERLF
ncbi:MAG TPA: SxtJ family membrane protein [Smithella sp.]|nr:SxtJ family membrane protein [Smithella sp.]